MLANQASDNSWVGRSLFYWLKHIFSTYSRTFVVSRKFFHRCQIFSQQFSVKTICKPELRAMLSFTGKQRTQRLSSPWWQLGNQKCWLSDIMQPIERTLLIFDYFWLKYLASMIPVGGKYDSRRELRIFLCPTLATCWLFHLFLWWYVFSIPRAP